MKIEIKQRVWVVLERWNLNILEHKVSVFDSKKKAEEYAEMSALKACQDIEDGTIKHAGDEACANGCDICVDNDDRCSDEWWEAYIEEKEIK